jgi:molecular chaperone GrpE
MGEETRNTIATEAAEEPEAEVSEGDELVALQAERDQFLADLQRVAADFENYRKRAARDQAALTARAAERVLRDLLPVLDGLEGALEAAGKHEEAKLEEGVRLVHRGLTDALVKHGLSEIDTNGTFDPHVHEAVLTQPSEADEGSIVNVLQKGYRLGDVVVRPARVAVSSGVVKEG